MYLAIISQEKARRWSILASFPTPQDSCHVESAMLSKVLYRAAFSAAPNRRAFRTRSAPKAHVPAELAIRPAQVRCASRLLGAKF
jgi:hypothetical protein